MLLAGGAEAQQARLEVDRALVEVGREYLETVYRFDFAAQRVFYTDESVFEDPSAAIFGQPYRSEGGDAIVGFFRGTLPETELTVRVEIQDAFIVGDRVHFYVHYHNTGDATPFGYPGERVTVVAKGFTILHIVGEKVLHHLDYIDYPGMFRQAREQVEGR
jgi:hypothetical protein